jgi:hypothetical protein
VPLVFNCHRIVFAEKIQSCRDWASAMIFRRFARSSFAPEQVSLTIPVTP